MTLLAIETLSSVFPLLLKRFHCSMTDPGVLHYAHYWCIDEKNPIGKIVIFEIAPFIIQINITFLKQRL